MTEELKYPHEWFEILKDQIPQPFRFEIEDNLDLSFGPNKCAKKDFISGICSWEKTSINYEYWADLFESFCKGDTQQLADKINEERWNNLRVGDALYSIGNNTTTGAVTEIYPTEVVITVGRKDNHNSKDNWFNYWTPINPKHWKEEGERTMQDEPKMHVNSKLAEIESQWTLTEENAIQLLKSKGYKIFKPKTEYEEI